MAYRLDCASRVRPHEALPGTGPRRLHLGLASPTTLTFQTKEDLANYLTRDKMGMSDRRSL